MENAFIKLVVYTYEQDSQDDFKHISEKIQALSDRGVYTIEKYLERYDTQLLQDCDFLTPFERFRPVAFFFNFMKSRYTIKFAVKLIELGIYTPSLLLKMDVKELAQNMNVSQEIIVSLFEMVNEEKNRFLTFQIFQSFWKNIGVSAEAGSLHYDSMFVGDFEENYYKFERITDYFLINQHYDFDIIDMLLKHSNEVENSLVQYFDFTASEAASYLNRSIQFATFLQKGPKTALKLYYLNLFEFATFFQSRSSPKLQAMFPSREHFMTFYVAAMRASHQTTYGSVVKQRDIRHSLGLAYFIQMIAPNVRYLSRSSSNPLDIVSFNISVIASKKHQIRHEPDKFFETDIDLVNMLNAIDVNVSGYKEYVDEYGNLRYELKFIYNRTLIEEAKHLLESGIRILMPFSIIFGHHANLLQIDPIQKTVEIWDPNYVRQTDFYADVLPVFFKQAFSIVFGMLFNVEHYASKECMAFHPQSMQGISDVSGQCATWTWWFAMVKAVYPYLTKEQIQKQYDNMENKSDFIDSFKRFFIENGDILDNTDLLVKKMTENKQLFKIHSSVCMNCLTTNIKYQNETYPQIAYCSFNCAELWLAKSKKL